MNILVFSSSKCRIAAPKHACRCVIAAISRIPANEKAGLRWVLMYVPFFLLSFSLLISCHRTGYHTSRSEALFHYMVRGFSKGGFAHKTIHVFSRRRSDVFPNGGKKWMPGRRRLNFKAKCVRLW